MRLTERQVGVEVIQKSWGSIHRFLLWSVFLVGLSIFTFLAPAALADFQPTVEEELEWYEQALEEPGYTHFGRGPVDIALEPYDRAREWANTNLGLDWVVAYSYLYQHRSHGCEWANRNTKGCEKWTNNSELDFLARWDLVDSEQFGQGSFNFMTTYIWEKRDYTGGGAGASTADVTASAGTAFTVSDSENLDARMRQAYWTQSLFDDGFEAHVGQIEVPSFFDGNRYANNDRDQFIGQVWTKNIRSNVNIFGLGAALSVKPNDLFYARAGFVDGNSNGENPKWSTFKRGEYIYLAELGFTPDIPGWGKGIYRISPYEADRAKTGAQGRGVTISFEQETPWDAALWLRGGISDHRRNEFEQFLGGGTVFTNPFGFNRDQVGLAFGWGRTADSSARRNTYLAEAYWRFQLTERFEFSPDLQMHLQPANQKGRAATYVAGLRGMVRF